MNVIFIECIVIHTFLIAVGRGSGSRRGRGGRNRKTDRYMATDDDGEPKSGNRKRKSDVSTEEKPTKKGKKVDEDAMLNNIIEASLIEPKEGQVTWCPYIHPDMQDTLAAAQTRATDSLDIPEELYIKIAANSKWMKINTKVTVDYMTHPPPDLLARYINPQRIKHLKEVFDADNMNNARLLVVTSVMSKKVSKLYNKIAVRVTNVEEKFPGAICNLIGPVRVLEECGFAETTIAMAEEQGQTEALTSSGLRRKSPGKYLPRKEGLENMPLWWRVRYSIWMLDSDFKETVQAKLLGKPGKPPPVLLYILAGNHSTAAAKAIDNAMPRNSVLHMDFMLLRQHALYIGKCDNETVNEPAEYTGQGSLDRPMQFRYYWLTAGRPKRKDVDRSGSGKMTGWSVSVTSRRNECHDIRTLSS